MKGTVLFDISNVVHILAVIPAASWSSQRSFSALCRLKTDLRRTMEQQRVCNNTLILKGHMPTLSSTMTWIVSLISSAVEMADTVIF